MADKPSVKDPWFYTLPAAIGVILLSPVVFIVVYGMWFAAFGLALGDKISNILATTISIFMLLIGNIMYWLYLAEYCDEKERSRRYRM